MDSINIDDRQHEESSSSLTLNDQECIPTRPFLKCYVDENTGSKGVMLGARELIIDLGDNTTYWEWSPFEGSRFPEVAKLKFVMPLIIKGTVKMNMLSPNTSYAAFLVYKLIEEEKYGLERLFVHVYTIASDEFPEPLQGNPSVDLEDEAVKRSDGWMEVEIGKFHNKVEDKDREAHADISAPNLYSYKKGLVVEGIEFRPINSIDTCDSQLEESPFLRYHVDEVTGLKCAMLGARELMIAHGDNSTYWKWLPCEESRFPDIAKLKFVWWLDIKGTVKMSMLSPNTSYEAFLVYKLEEENTGLECALVYANTVESDEIAEPERERRSVYLKDVEEVIGNVAVKRSDGWMEVEIAKFYNEEGNDRDVHAEIWETNTFKQGLVVEGIEFRPVNSINTCDSQLEESMGSLTLNSNQELISASPFLKYHVDEITGMKCVILGARELMIEYGDNSSCWEWSPCGESRFPDVAKLKGVSWLDVKGTVKMSMLSPNTSYAAFLVYKLEEENSGLGLVIVYANTIESEDIEDRKRERGFVHLEDLEGILKNVAMEEILGNVAVKRSDGWMEVEIGKFYNEGEDNHRKVNAEIWETNTSFSKKGLVVEGIEFRPAESLDTRDSQLEETINSPVLNNDQELTSTSPFLKYHVNEMTGMKSVILGARELFIAYGDNSSYWEWLPYQDSRFPEVAKLNYVWWLDIKGTVKSNMLSPNTTYAAFLLYKLEKKMLGSGLERASIYANTIESDEIAEPERERRFVHLEHVEEVSGNVAIKRYDGWMEIEIAKFYNEGEDNDNEVHAEIWETVTSHVKRGLVIEGIEFRPVSSSDLTIAILEKQLATKKQEVIELEQVLQGMKRFFSALEGRKKYYVDENTGSTSLLLGARELMITHGNNSSYWKWSPCKESRFPEVAKLEVVWWLDIKGTVKMSMLSPNTSYAAFLVYKLEEGNYGLESALIYANTIESDEIAEPKRERLTVHFKDVEDVKGNVSVKRIDGWMEVEIAKFYNEKGNDRAVQAEIWETDTSFSKGGLIVEGIEFRPCA